ncbi:MAG: hypothetical protein WCG98_02415 [bacterium]
MEAEIPMENSTPEQLANKFMAEFRNMLQRIDIQIKVPTLTANGKPTFAYFQLQVNSNGKSMTN